MSSSIGQSILMAITTANNGGRRGLVLAAVIAQLSSDSKAQLLSSNKLKLHTLPLLLLFSSYVVKRCRFEDELFTEYLKKSEVNKAKNDKERLDSYYKRNYKDYFEFVEGSLEGKSEQQLTESEKGIRNWLKANKN
ncbi:unnamed protein product [Rhodiola kirilowii]